MSAINELSPALAAAQEWISPTTEVPADQVEEIEVPEMEIDMPNENVPDGTIDEVVAWVGDVPDRRKAALDAEKKGKNRKGLIDKLS